MDLGKLVARLTKEFSSANVMTLDEVPVLDTISSGIPSLDWAMGTGGFPCGLVTEIYGEGSVGKSTLAFKTIAEAQKRGIVPALITTEGIPDPRWPRTCGVDTEGVIVLFAHTAEQMLEQAKTISASPDIGLMIIDSLGAVNTQKEISEGGVKQAFGNSGIITQMIGALLPNCWTTKKACLLMNQIRDQSTFKPGIVTHKSPGGHSLHHGSSIRIQLRNTANKSEAKSGGEAKEIGKEIRARIIKNKAGSPENKATWWLYHSVPDQEDEDDPFPGLGIDTASSLVEVGVKLGVIQGPLKLSIPEVHFEQDKSTGLGRANLTKWFRANPESMESVYALVRERLGNEISRPSA